MLEAVGQVGYEGASVRAVLDRTQLYRQAFYDHFASKEDCYLQAFDHALARIEAGLRAAAGGEGDWTGQLRAGLGALLDFLDTSPERKRSDKRSSRSGSSCRERSTSSTPRRTSAAP